MLVPEIPKLTFWLLETALEVVAVTVIAVVPASLPTLLLTDKLTVGFGATSLSVILAVIEAILIAL
ncbi:hypothetical protein [Microcoleus sp. SVA1_A1]|uniref:hypothetical protein n=1 Tax=Microcoleus sp. SVA1_A1 TaxID=2818946 RepID=UPI002FCEEC65